MKAEGSQALVDEIDGTILPTAGMIELMHAMQLRRFGGGAGLRDPGLLKSAVSRGISTILYGEGSAVMAACAICEGIIRNHPFIDGNKRAGFAALTSTLSANGFRFEMDPETAAHMIVDFAASRLDADGFREMVVAHVTLDRTHARIEEISRGEGEAAPGA